MKVIFLDRDGVINENRPDHVKSWEEFVFLPGALEALRFLYQSGWMTFVITNQAAIHRGLVQQSTVEEINRCMQGVVEAHGGKIEEIFYCPHRPDEGCYCRKPQPGLLLEAARRYNLQLESCTLIGDALSDIAAGQAVGCECILVRSGRGQAQLASRAARSFSGYGVASDLLAAVRWIDKIERTLFDLFFHQPLTRLTHVQPA